VKLSTWTQMRLVGALIVMEVQGGVNDEQAIISALELAGRLGREIARKDERAARTALDELARLADEVVPGWADGFGDHVPLTAAEHRSHRARIDFVRRTRRIIRRACAKAVRAGHVGAPR
jgi:hypothetical protein